MGLAHMSGGDAWEQHKLMMHKWLYKALLMATLAYCLDVQRFCCGHDDCSSAPNSQDGAPQHCPAGCELRQQPNALHQWRLNGRLLLLLKSDALIEGRRLVWCLSKPLSIIH